MAISTRSKKIVGAMAMLLMSVIIVIQGCAPRLETLEVDGRKRHYLLHVPENLPLDASVPLVLALHQFSDTPRGMQLMTGFNRLADSEGFIVAYPKGKWRVWRSGAHDDDQDTRFLNALLDELLSQYAIDATRIYATGASAGAMMVQSFALRTNRFAAIAPVMGTLTEDYITFEHTGASLPVLIIHGIDDPVIPFEGGRAGGPHDVIFLSAEATAAFWASHAGCDDTPTITTEKTGSRDADFVRRYTWNCPGKTQTLLLAVGGCGHSWPGHASRYPEFIVGASVATPDASAIIWDFFEGFALSAKE